MTTDARAFAERLEEAGVPYEVLEDVIRSLAASRERFADGRLPAGVLGEVARELPAALAAEVAALAGGPAHTGDLDRAVDFLVSARVAWESVRWLRTRLARWDRFPVGAELAGGRYRLVERVRGGAARGQFRAVVQGEETTGLVTVGRHPAPARSIEELGRQLAWQVPGVTPLRHVGRIDGELVAVIEQEPDGMPSHELALPLAPALAVRLAHQLAEVLAAFHAAVGPLRFLRPELVYVEEGDGRVSLTALAPRAEAFLAGAAPSWGAPPLFDTAFAAPEVVRLGEPTAAADVFSLAAMVGLWLSGQHLFAGDTAMAQMEAIASGRGRLWQGPVAIGMVLADAVASEPTHRPTLARFIGDLERAAGRP